MQPPIPRAGQSARISRGAALKGSALAVALALGIAGAATLHDTAPAWGRTVVNGQQVITPTTFSELAEKVGPAVVSVQVSGRGVTTSGRDPRDMFPPGSPFRDFFDRFFDEDGQPRFDNDRRGDRFGERRDRDDDRDRAPQRRRLSQGSGFIISPEGHVVTNEHVIDGADEVTVVLGDGTEFKAKVLGHDSRTDLAVLKIDADRELPHVSWVEGEAKVGEIVMAVGNPFGLGGTVTTGIISSLGRHIGSGPYDDFIQIDAAVNRGNSGGPTFNLEGEVIGVITAIFSPNGGSVGIGFAIPAHIAKNVVGELIEHGDITRGWIGVSIQDLNPALAEGVGLDGTKGSLVAEVFEGGPARAADVRPGDVILEVNGEEVADSRDLAVKIADVRPGETARLTVQRDGKPTVIEVELGRMPANPELASRGGDQDKADEPDETLSRLAELGLEVEPVTAPGEKGVLVSDVRSGSEADDKGISRGDLILSVAGQQVNSPAALEQALVAARSDNLSSVLVLLRSQSGQRFVALSLPKA
jgi:serine protease Do